MTWLASTLLVGSSLLLTFMAILGLRRRQLSSIVFLATAAYAFVAVLNADNLIKQFNEELYVRMSLVYSIGSFLLAISVQFFSEFVTAGKLSTPLWDQSDHRRHTVLATTFAVASLAAITTSREGDILLSWSDARGADGFLTALATFLFLLASPGMISALKTRSYALGVTLFLLCAVLFVAIGSRASLIAALVLGIWLMLVGAKNRSARLRIIAFAVIGVLVTHTFLRTLRGFGIAGLLQAFNDGNLLTALFTSDTGMDLSGGEADMPIYLMFAISISSIHDFGFMTSIQRLLLLPMPSIAGLTAKPVDVTNLLWEKAFTHGLFDGAEGQASLAESYLTGTFGSLHPTIFGEYFLAGGWLSLVLSVVILGALLVAIDYLMHRLNGLASLALCGPVLVGYLFVARGNSVIGLGFFFYLGAMIGLLFYSMKFAKVLCRAAVKRNESIIKTP